jgi:putative tryptophan/tyrosine transport system permease protein
MVSISLARPSGGTRMLDLALNALLQGLTFGIAALGLAIAFRVARFPDLTADGSFMIGASVFAALMLVGSPWWTALPLAAVAGALLGLLTKALHAFFGVNRLLSGILTTMAAYSLAFRILGGHANVGLLNQTLPFTPGAQGQGDIVAAAAFALVTVVGMTTVLRSEAGLLMRASGANPELVQSIGRHPTLYIYAGLALANALIAVSGALVSAQQGFADINMGIGALVAFVASLVIGEEIILRVTMARRLGILAIVLAPMIGSVLYFAFHLGVLRLSLAGILPLAIEPTDLKLFSAAIVVAVLALRRGSRRDEDIIPL